MNFFGVGPLELIVILVVALVFVGPERLPRLAADIARTIREIRKYTGSIAAEFGEVLQEFERDTAEDRSQWKEIGQGLTDATKSVSDALREAHAAAAAPASAATRMTPATNGANGSAPAAPTDAPRTGIGVGEAIVAPTSAGNVAPNGPASAPAPLTAAEASDPTTVTDHPPHTVSEPANEAP
ncbi:MAG: twin-arginine translocase TatA/TatE family subunit [Dehalococcoidia bacterium]|nr:twin-arginine translocase TatA/TatE family subunit [Dehalococcoidia bacterium]